MSVSVAQKAWTVSANVRNAFTTLGDMMGWFLFQNASALLSPTSQLGGSRTPWSCVWSCDGTTGPTSSADHTNRWSDKTKAATQGATQATAHSYIVLSNADGVQLLLENVGATADVGRIAYSPGGLYVLAGTTTQSPTATDEVPLSVGNSLVNATTSLDRVMSIFCRDDSQGWRCCLFRSSTLIACYGLERIVPMVSTRTSNPIFSVPYVGYRFTSLNRTTTATDSPTGGANGTAVGTAGNAGAMARVFTDVSRIIRIGGGEIVLLAGSGSTTSNAGTLNANKPALQNAEGSPLIQPFWQGEKAANMDGFLGYPVDFWSCYTSSLTTPAVGDLFPGYQQGDNLGGASRSNWYVALGSAMVIPWNNSSASLQIA